MSTNTEEIREMLGGSRQADPVAWRWKIRLNEAWCYDDRKPYSYPEAQPLYTAPPPSPDPVAVKALEEAQKVLSVLIDPKMSHVNSLHIWAQAVDAEKHTRTALQAIRGEKK